MKTTLPRKSFAAIAAIATLAALLAGCESSESGDSYLTTSSKKQSSTPSTPATSSETVNANVNANAGTGIGSAAPDDGEIGGEDAVPFSALSWNYGGFKGGSATKTEATIVGLSASHDSMTYRWAGGGCETLGASSKSDYSNTLACFFVQRVDGRWVGGKFDFISTSRTSRPFTNIYEGYKGWSLANVPNPCPCAFVIVSADGKRRTNVTAGTWHR